jgi:radical SAM protein with 4Fe4S-binding SPASM domain
MGLLLSSKVKLRPDGGRAILFSTNTADGIEDDAFRFLYPQQVVMLSLFNGQRDLSEIHDAVAYLFNLDINDAVREVGNLLAIQVNSEQTIGSFIIDASDIDLTNARVYNPNDFIVPAETVDMSDVRCKIPFSLLVLPTMRCYTNCRYCYADKEGCQESAEFSLPLFRRLLKEARECGAETIEFSGGDIFCRKDAFELIQCTRSEGMYPSIPTKYPLSKDQIEQLAKMGLSTIQISIDALDPDIIDGLVAKKPGYGKRILKTLDYLGEAGIRVRTNSVLTPYNIRDAVNLARYLAEMPHVFRSNFTCYARSLYRHQDSLFCSLSDIDEFEKGLNQIRDKFPHKAINFNGPSGDPYDKDETKRTSAFWDRAFCTANRRGCVVLPDGRVTICEELYFHEYFIIGDLNKQTLMEVWNSPRALELAYPDQATVPDGPCKDCPDFRRCHEGLGRCVREALKAYGYDKPHWPDPRCPRAPVGTRLE